MELQTINGVKINDLIVSKNLPLYVYELLISLATGSFEVLPNPRTYNSLNKLYLDLDNGTFNGFEKSNPSDCQSKGKNICYYETFVVFVDNKKSSKYSWKHEHMLYIPRLVKS